MMTPLVNFARLFTTYLLVLSVTAFPRPAAKSMSALARIADSTDTSRHVR
jgi:hypothetical protein